MITLAPEISAIVCSLCPSTITRSSGEGSADAPIVPIIVPVKREPNSLAGVVRSNAASAGDA